eukprot:Amastigsp_a339904_8.p3 type:complete len:101 gc:universal Amastigsp_a339904_8:901-599(-)
MGFAWRPRSLCLALRLLRKRTRSRGRSWRRRGLGSLTRGWRTLCQHELRLSAQRRFSVRTRAPAPRARSFFALPSTTGRLLLSVSLAKSWHPWRLRWHLD